MAKAKEYVSVAERAKDDPASAMVVPLDFMILDKLPDEGTLMGGYFPITAFVEELGERHFKELTSDQIGGRLRSMAAIGLTVMVKTVGAGKQSRRQHGWQRTEKGKEVLAAWQARQQ